MSGYKSVASGNLGPEARALLDGRNYAVLATYRPDERVQQSVMWVLREDNDLLFSTIEGRVKHRNLLRDNRASAVVYNAADPEEYVAVEGTVSIHDDSSSTFSNVISHKYTGADHVESDPSNVRVVLRLRPDRATYRAG